MMVQYVWVHVMFHRPVAYGAAEVLLRVLPVLLC